MTLHSTTQSDRSQRAFTLVEILTAMGLLLIMTLGLVLMFNQTQRAFRSGLRQVDVMETSRATFELISRDVQQMSRALTPGITNADIRLQSTVEPVIYVPPVLAVNVTNQVTNFIQNFYFLTALSNDFQGVGYRVFNLDIGQAQLNQTGNILIGTLYRFYANTNELEDNYFFDLFMTNAPYNLIKDPAATNRLFRRVIDGVVHFYVRPYDREGRLFTNSYSFESPVLATNDAAGWNQTNWAFSTLLYSGGLTSAVPSYIEVELGVMEPHVVEQIKPIVASGNVAAVRSYIINHLGAVHIFRQQIPIRTALR